MDSLEERPCHEVLQPLRRAVYARCGLKSVKEYLCNPQISSSVWLTGPVLTQRHEILSYFQDLLWR